LLQVHSKGSLREIFISDVKIIVELSEAAYRKEVDSVIRHLLVGDISTAVLAAARKNGSESRFQLIDDTDLAGTIPYLSKGK
jgi:hypothetical protein